MGCIRRYSEGMTTNQSTQTQTIAQRIASVAEDAAYFAEHLRDALDYLGQRYPEEIIAAAETTPDGREMIGRTLDMLAVISDPNGIAAEFLDNAGPLFGVKS